MRRSFGWLPALAITFLWLAGASIFLAQKEAPTGRLLGTVVSEETGVAIPDADINLRQIGNLRNYYNQKTTSDGSFEFRNLPVGSYWLKASSRAHGLYHPVHVIVKEGKTPPHLQLELLPKPPYFELRIQQHVFSPEETPQVTCHGFLRQSDLDFEIYQVDSEALSQHYGNLRSVIYQRNEQGHPIPLDENPALHEFKRVTRAITQKDVEGIFHQRFDLPTLDPGMYLLVVRAGPLVELDWLMLTRLGLITKTWGSDTLAFVTDLKTGEPVPEAKVTLSFPHSQTVSGFTSKDGVFKASMPFPVADPQEDHDRSLFVLAEKGGSHASITEYLRYYNLNHRENRVFSYTDRPVYRPGHKVRFKGSVRTLVKEDYSVPADTPIEVKAWDSRETLVYSAKLTTNDFGSYFGEFDLNEEASTGYYRLVTKVDNDTHASSFHVAEYRKPEYTVEVAPEKPRYTRGDTISAKVSAQYYFGAPVAGADVSYTIMRSPYYAYYDDYEYDDYYYEDEYYDEYTENYGYYGGEIIAEGNAVTGPDGVAQITFSTKPSPSLSTKGEEASRDYRYIIDAQVTDPGRRSVSAQASTLVVQGEFYLNVSPKRYIVSPNESSEVEIIAKDHDGKPVPGLQILATASTQIWRAGKSQSKEESRATLTTDDNGHTTFKFTPKGQGNYYIEARASDKRKNKIRGAGYLWVSGYYFSSEDRSYPDLEIIADKKNYRIGETAIVLVNTKSKGATALVTVEGPTLFKYRLIELKGNSTRLEIPITEQYSPNFFIGVAFVHDKDFVSKQKRIRVSTERRAIQVKVTPNKSRYSPGEKATYSLQTNDWQGNPVSAEVSMSVVDESIFAIRKDTTPKMVDFFYPQRSNRVQTAFSFPRIYLDYGKEGPGGQAINVRKRFPDTAFWNPTIVTDTAGKATVSFEIPDTLTTWRATARGITLDTAVGETTAKALCSKDLLVRLETPRFFVQRDRLTLSAIVHNYTKDTQNLSVWLEVPGLFSKLGDKNPKPVDFSLEPDGIHRVDWEMEVPTPGTRQLTVYAKAASGLSDAVQLTLPALPHGRERLEWRSGAVDTDVEELFTLRQDAVPNAGDLRIRISPSLASVVLGALEYLAKYPYGCTEQTMSAFLPDVVVAGALKELNISNPELESELPKMVQKGLDRLYRFQHDDGGWGWWRYDDSDPWMTSYVVFGLLTAKEHGFEVNNNVLNRGLRWLDRASRAENPLTSERAYLLHVLALAGRNGPVDIKLTQFAHNTHSLDSHTLALTVSSLLLKNKRSAASSVAEALWQKSEETRTLLHWKGNSNWGRGGDVETTALAFKALYELNPKDPRLPKVLRWLVLKREGNRWTSTRDTAFVIYALTDYLRESRELQPDYQATVTLNGKTVIDRHFGPEDIFLPEFELKIPQKDLAKSDNKILITKEGEGKLYYTLILRQFIDQEEIPKVITGAGISVRREYYPIVTTRDPRTGVISTAPSPNPTTELESGKPVLVRLTVTTPKEYEYIVIEDPLPAGCEVNERGDINPWEWSWWWSDMEVRDEKVAFFTRWLRPGTHTLEYHLVPQIPGDYHVMPTAAYSMYDPDIRGSGAETRVRLKP